LHHKPDPNILIILRNSHSRTSRLYFPLPKTIDVRLRSYELGTGEDQIAMLPYAELMEWRVFCGRCNIAVGSSSMGDCARLSTGHFQKGSSMGDCTSSGCTLPKRSGPHARVGGDILEGIYVQGCITIEESKISGRSGMAGGHVLAAGGRSDPAGIV
jgi:hypothetical protein